MKRKTILSNTILRLCFLLLFETPVFAQETFTRLANQSIYVNGVRNLSLLTDSSYVIFSNNLDNGYSRFMLSMWSKTDSLLWSQDYWNGTGDFMPSQMIRSMNGEYVLAGGQGNLVVMRTNASGSVLWTRSIDNGNNEYADGVVELLNRDLLISGHGQDAFLCKLDSSGNVIWNKKFHLEKNTLDCRLLKLNTGAICLVGTVENNMSYSYDIFLTSVDTAGNPIWHKVLNAKADEFVSNCIVDAGGNILITGRIIKQPNGRYYSFITKVSSTGAVLFFYEYSDPAASVSFNDIVTETNGQYLIAGDIQDSIPGMNNFQDPILLRVNATGEVSWGTRFLFPYRETLSAILQLPGEHLLFAGSQDNAGVTELLEIKTNKSGYASCSQIPYTLNKRVIDAETDSPPVADSIFFAGNALSMVQASDTPVVTAVCFDTSRVGAYFTTAANSICAGGALTFSNQSVNAISHRWYVNGILADTSINFIHTFSSTGVDTIKLAAATATDSSFYYLYITVDSPPLAGFSTTGKLLRNNFFDASVGSTSYLWDFGDGFSSSEKNPFHTYVNTGYYNVCLTAASSCGSDLKCKSLSIIDTVVRRFTHLYSDNFYHAVEDNDGGFICIGELGVNAQVGLTKTDNDGNVIWSRPFPLQTNVTTVKSLLPCSNNGYAFLTQEYNTHSSAIVRTDSAGDILWRKEFYTASNTQGLFKMCLTPDSGFVMAGLGSSPAPVLIKLNRYGETEWCYKYPAGANAFSVTVTSANQFLICGRSGSGNIYLIKMNSLGHIIWAKEYVDANGDSQGYCVLEAADGNYLVAANGKSPVNIPLGTDLLLLKTDTAGGVIWNKYFDLAYFENPGGLLEDSHQNILLSKENNSDFADILKLDATGNVLKGNYYYTALPAKTHYAGLSLTRDNGIITCGVEEDYPCNSCNGGIVMKLDSTFDAPCNGVTSVISTGNRTLTMSNVNEAALIEPGVIPGIYSNLYYTIASDSMACYYEVVYPLAVPEYQSSTITIFPNPAFSAAAISFSDTDDRTSTITLADIYGKTVGQYSGIDSNYGFYTIQLPGLPPGMYFITVHGEKNTITKKLLVHD